MEPSRQPRYLSYHRSESLQSSSWVCQSFFWRTALCGAVASDESQFQRDEEEDRRSLTRYNAPRQRPHRLRLLDESALRQEKHCGVSAILSLSPKGQEWCGERPAVISKSSVTGTQRYAIYLHARPRVPPFPFAHFLIGMSQPREDLESQPREDLESRHPS